MAPKSKAEDDALGSLTSMPDISALDIDAGADEVSDEAAVALLSKLGVSLGGGPPAPKSAAKAADEALIASLTGGQPPAKPIALPSPPMKSSQPAAPAVAATSAAAPTVGARVDARVKEYQVAAVLAKKDGRGEEALVWLRRSKELARAIDAVLQMHPPCSECPVDDPAAALPLQ